LRHLGFGTGLPHVEVEATTAPTHRFVDQLARLTLECCLDLIGPGNAAPLQLFTDQTPFRARAVDDGLELLAREHTVLDQEPADPKAHR
jgi:hypothetical protein